MVVEKTGYNLAVTIITTSKDSADDISGRVQMALAKFGELHNYKFGIIRNSDTRELARLASIEAGNVQMGEPLNPEEIEIARKGFTPKTNKTRARELG
jgi:hypothetical protein